MSRVIETRIFLNWKRFSRAENGIQLLNNGTAERIDYFQVATGTKAIQADRDLNLSLIAPQILNSLTNIFNL